VGAELGGGGAGRPPHAGERSRARYARLSARPGLRPGRAALAAGWAALRARGWELGLGRRGAGLHAGPRGGGGVGAVGWRGKNGSWAAAELGCTRAHAGGGGGLARWAEGGEREGEGGAGGLAEMGQGRGLGHFSFFLLFSFCFLFISV
jgi:hypothetical protein